MTLMDSPLWLKNVHFLSPWHSPSQPPDTIDFTFLCLPRCTHSRLVFCSGVEWADDSENVSERVWEKKRNRRFVYEFVRLIVFMCLWVIHSQRYETSCISTRTPDINNWTECSAIQLNTTFLWWILTHLMCVLEILGLGYLQVCWHRLVWF